MKANGFALLLAGVTASAVFAADCTWTGNGVDFRWSNPDNWEGGNAPTGNGDNAFFPAGTKDVLMDDASASIRTVYFRNPGMTLTVAAGCNLHFSNGGGLVVRAEEDATIDGGGTISFSTGNEQENWADNQVLSGKTLTISVKITGENGFEHNGTGGIIVLTNPNNDFQGCSLITGAGGISIPSIGNAGSPQPLGMAGAFKFKNAPSFLRYTGGAASTDLIISQDAGNAADATLEHAGTGTLTFTGPFRSGSDNAHAFIFTTAEPSAMIDLAGTVYNGGSAPLWLRQRGPGTLRVSSACTHTGNTIIEGGTLVVTPAGSLGTGTLLRMSGGHLELNSSAPLGAMQVDGGSSKVINYAPSLVIDSLTYISGTIDFHTLASTFIASQPTGLIGVWATVNGQAAFAAYDPVTGIHAVPSMKSQNLFALGPSVILDDPTSATMIIAPGTGGGITLENPTTETALLSQEVNTPALITFGGDTLVTPLVRVALGGASLTLGDVPDDGVLTAPASTDFRLMLQNQNAASGVVLTVNAAIADNGPDALGLDVNGVGDVVLAGPINHTGGTWLSDNAMIVSNAVDLTWPDGGIHGTGGFTKTGDGTLFMPNIGNSYAGTTIISGGIVNVLNSDTFGAKSAPTVITSGGAVNLAGINNGSLRLDAEKLFAEGAGPDGLGAIRNTGDHDQLEAFRLLELTGNLTLYATRRFDIRNAGGPASVNLNGFDFIKKGSAMFCLTSTTVSGDNGTSSIDIQEGRLSMEAITTLSGDANNNVWVRNGARLDFWNLYTPVIWSLNINNGGGVTTRGGYGTDINVWAGPVSLSGEAFFTSDEFSSDTYTGVISGAGKMVKTGNAGGTTFLLGTANTFSDGARIEGGALYAVAPGSLPNWDTKVTVQNAGTLALRVADEAGLQPGFSLNDIDTLLNNGTTFQSTTASIGFDTAYEDLDFTAPIPHVGVRKLGPNTLTLSGTGADLGPVRVYSGTLDLSPQSRYLDENNIIVGESDQLATLIVSEQAQITTLDRGTWGDGAPPRPQVIIGNNGRGVMYVSDDAFINGRTVLGNANNTAGAIYQTGGTVHNTGGHSNDGQIGNNGYGYYLLAGGTYLNNGYSQVANATQGVGVLHQTGGTFDFSGIYEGAYGISRGGTGQVFLEGGEFNSQRTLWVGDQNGGDRGGYAEFTVTGDAVATINGAIDMGHRHDSISIVNLNSGGELNANRFWRADGRWSNDNYVLYGDSNKAYVNFNGGLFRAMNGDSELFSGGASGVYPEVTVHAGGASIDIPDTGKSKAVNTPMNKPQGSGVLSVPITSRGAGYLGSPIVRFSGGDGGGASAFARIKDGELDSIEITSPGSYASIPTVSLHGGGATTAAVIASPNMAPVPSGGLTKLGAGNLALNAANTFEGPTEIREGTLLLNHPAALSPYSEVSVTGGTLDLGGNTLANGDVSVTEGSIVHGRIATEILTKTGPGTLTLESPISLAPPPPPHPPTPGLWEGMVRHNWDTWTPNPKTGIQLTPRAAIGGQTSNNNYAGGMWAGNNHTWIYTGYIWNHEDHDVTWSFRGRFDDHVRLTINGGIWIDTGNGDAVVQNVVMSPGPNAIEMRFGDGSGDVGPGGGEYFGLSYDPLGRASSNRDDYLQILDPGDGSLLTAELPDLSGPGLLESFIPSSWDTSGDGTLVSRQLTTRAGNGTVESNATYAGGLWRGNNHTWIYRGFLWNRDENPVTWRWRFQFDDNVMLTINGVVVRDVILSEGTQYGTCELLPGPNEIEIRFGDGGGDAGPGEGLGGLTYDPTNNGSNDLGYFILLEDPGDGSLLTTDIASGLPPIPPPDRAVVNVTEGIVQLGNTSVAGLIEGLITDPSGVDNHAFNTWTPNPRDCIELTTTAANGGCNENGYVQGKFWPNNSTYVYTGYIWNRTGTSQTWTFAENSDDSVRLVINGTTVLNDSSWDRPTYGTITLSPGAHTFEVRFGQGTGGAGANIADWWTRDDMAFGIDFQGRDEPVMSNYEILADPGDGSFLTWTAFDMLNPEHFLDGVQVNLASGTFLDLNESSHRIGEVTGTGTVINGALATGTVISPAGDDAIGTLTLDGATLEQGVTYRLTTLGTDSDCLISTGPLDLSGLTIVPATDLPNAPAYLIAQAPDFIGKPTLDGFPTKYKIMRRGTDLLLTSLGGTIMILR